MGVIILPQAHLYLAFLRDVIERQEYFNLVSMVAFYGDVLSINDEIAVYPPVNDKLSALIEFRQENIGYPYSAVTYTVTDRTQTLGIFTVEHPEPVRIYVGIAIDDASVLAPLGD